MCFKIGSSDGTGKRRFGNWAGRRSVDESVWKSEVLRLIRNASVIISIPSGHEGTRWEIGVLKDLQLLDRTIFVMPPHAEPTLQDDWQSSIESVPVWMPPYDDSGALYTVDAWGELDKIVDLKIKSMRDFVERLRDVLPQELGDLVTYRSIDQPIARAFVWVASFVIVVSLFLVGVFCWSMIHLVWSRLELDFVWEMRLLA